MNHLQPVNILNPGFEPFETTYDTNEDGNPLTYRIEGREIKQFPRFIAEHLAKHLASKLVDEQGIKTNPAADFKLMYNRILMQENNG